jgi:hypothetical protein
MEFLMTNVLVNLTITPAIASTDKSGEIRMIGKRFADAGLDTHVHAAGINIY